MERRPEQWSDRGFVVLTRALDPEQVLSETQITALA
jgi:hypothetical protein